MTKGLKVVSTYSDWGFSGGRKAGSHDGSSGDLAVWRTGTRTPQ